MLSVSLNKSLVVHRYLFIENGSKLRNGPLNVSECNGNFLNVFCFLFFVFAFCLLLFFKF